MARDRKKRAFQCADDRFLVEAYLQGDTSALGIIFKRYSDSAYAAAMRVLSNPSEAEDAVQEGFMKVMKGLRSYRGESSLKAWIMKTVIRTCIDMIRKESRRRKREERASKRMRVVLTDGDAESVNTTQLVKKALDEIPQAYRIPVWLHHHEGMSFREVGVILSLTENTARSRASRGIAKVRKILHKAGVSLGTTALVAAVRSVEAEPSPIALSEKLLSMSDNTPAFSENAVPGRRVGYGSASNIVKTAAVLLCVGSITTIAWFGWHKEERFTAEQRCITDKPVHYIIDFNKPQDMEFFDFRTGKWMYSPEGGMKNTGCLKRLSGVSYALFMKPLCLPIRVTLKYRHHRDSYSNSEIVDGFTWTPCEKMAVFRNVGRMYNVNPDSWVECEYYISRTFISRYTEGHLSSLVLTEPLDQSRLGFFLYSRQGKNIQLLDDLTIKTVSSDDVPDVSTYIREVEKIAPEKRKGKVILDSIKPVNGKYVYVLFGKAAAMKGASE